MSRLRSDQLIEAWHDRYVRDLASLEEMEAGVERALSGLTTDAEYVQLIKEYALRVALRKPQTLENTDVVLKSLYLGPIQG